MLPAALGHAVMLDCSHTTCCIVTGCMVSVARSPSAGTALCVLVLVPHFCQNCILIVMPLLKCSEVFLLTLTVHPAAAAPFKIAVRFSQLCKSGNTGKQLSTG